MKICALIFMLMIGACSPQSNIANEIRYLSDGVSVACYLKKMVVKDISDEDRKIFGIRSDKQTYVFAKLSVVNSSDIAKTINIANYYLSLDNSKSSKVYIDSIADIIISDKKLKPKETYTANVYWVFDGEISQQDFHKLTLAYSPQTTQLNKDASQ
jgi:hypothetical protein